MVYQVNHVTGINYGAVEEWSTSGILAFIARWRCCEHSNHLGADAIRGVRYTVDGDAGGVAPESRDILLDPSERIESVLHGIVAAEFTARSSKPEGRVR